MHTHRCAICWSRSIFIQNSGRAAYTAPGTAANASRRSFEAVRDTRSGFRQTALPLGRDQGASDNRPRSTYLRTSSAGVLPFRFALTKARPTGCKVICAPDRLVSGHRPPACCPHAPAPAKARSANFRLAANAID